MLKSIRNHLANLITGKNAMSLPDQFLRFGSRGQMTANWDEVIISDRELYSGYTYAAIKNRAVNVARVASEQIRTESTDPNSDLIHPYCPLIWDSENFTEFQFWSNISTFLDLEGVFYLMAIRAFDGKTRYGTIKAFKLLNPYNIRRVLDKDNLEVVGYVETRKGFVREIPKHMIIEIRELNPFSEDEPYAMTDAAKESQFTLKTSGDYTRHVIRNNINAPGILSTDVILEDKQFENFKARVAAHTKGEPLFGNGSGAITWQSMTSDLSKAALKDTNEINRDMLLSTAGVSKTILGIEQSGTTRETAKVQKDLNIENQILPRIQLIIDALNMDYRVHYKQEYMTTEAYLVVDNPQEIDQSSEKTKAEVQQAKFDLYQDMVAAGYSPKKASGYIEGEIEIDSLGKPKEVKPAATDTTTTTDTTETAPTNAVKKKDNKLKLEESDVIEKQKTILKNSIVHIERELVAAAISKIEKNQYEAESDVVSPKKKKSLINDLALVLSTFYIAVYQIKGPQTMDERLADLGLVAIFKLDREIQNYIDALSDKVATSHINTVTTDVLTVAREAAKEGLSRSEIISRIKQEFTDEISTTRAETIARTETNRAFTQAQYDADRQFIKQNNLEGRAYKVWRTRSANPCSFCEALAAEGKIPFDVNFRDLGEEVVVGSGADQKKLNISFEALEAGNAHPNCSCIYELVIE